MIFCFVRETKQLTLEELDRKLDYSLPFDQSNLADNPFAEVFSVPTKQFISYEIKTFLPYVFKRHVLRRNIPKPPPIIEKENRD